MTRMTEAYKVRVHKCKLGILIRVLYVVHLGRLPDPSVSPALLAHVAIAAQDLFALGLPGRRVVIKQYHGKKKQRLPGERGKRWNFCAPHVFAPCGA